jgi:tRNA(Leu) C34 or U34 (ribose-2'-O)-methylase TrmL
MVEKVNYEKIKYKLIGRQTQGISLQPADYMKLRTLALANSMTISEYIRMVLREYWKQNNI